MSNVTTLQSNYNIITNNNLTIDNILETINNLPEAGSGEEDLTTVLENHDTAITTQETTIDQIAAALEGKASGSGLSGENVTLTINYNLSSSAVAAYLTYVYYDDNNTLVGGYNNFVNSSSSTSVPVAKGSYVHIAADGITTGTRIDNSTLTTEALESPNSEIIQVNEEGSLTISIYATTGGSGGSS